MIITERGYTFESSGRRLDPNNNLISINDDLDVAEGYDNHMHLKAPTDEEEEEEDHKTEHDLTKEERVELADFMISLWEKFKHV